MTGHHFQQHAGRSLGAQVFLRCCQDNVGILIGNKTERQFGKGFFGQDGFGSGALITASDAIDLGCRPGADSLDCRETLFPEEFNDTGQLFNSVFSPSGLFQVGGGFAFPRLQRSYGIVETGDEHTPRGIM